MICLVIKGPTFEEARQQIADALIYANLVELRLDHFAFLDQKSVEKLRAEFSIPMIFTLRCQSQSGGYAGSEDSRLNNLMRLAELKPDYLDLENHVPSQFIQEMALKHPEIKLILSYHNFEETPKDLDGLYLEMKKIPAHFYKIAVTAHSSIDALRLICWAKKPEKNLIAISMGAHGQISRILAPIIGCPITYASLDENLTSAPGQLSAKTLIEKYRYHSLTSQTAIFGLIGDPVNKSISDVTHNDLIKHMKWDAVYIKSQISASELLDFIAYAKKLPFTGLSITMPLKEHIIPLIDHIEDEAKTIGAVNTLLFEKDKISGFNTDSIGALNALEGTCLVNNKRVIILGAGGAAKAIAYEAKKRGALVTILNREKKRAIDLATQLDCIGAGLEDMPKCAAEGYDFLINCTPIMPIDPQDILTQAIVMDIVTKPRETVFLKQAQKKGCSIVYGYQMFIEQAIGQFNYWKDGNDSLQCRKILETSISKVLI